MRKTSSLKKITKIFKIFKKKIRIQRTQRKLYVADTDLLPRSPFRNEGFIVQLLEYCWKTAFTCQTLSGIALAEDSCLPKWPSSSDWSKQGHRAQHPATILANSKGFPATEFSMGSTMAFADTTLQTKLSLMLPFHSFYRCWS